MRDATKLRIYLNDDKALFLIPLKEIELIPSDLNLELVPINDNSII